MMILFLPNLIYPIRSNCFNNLEITADRELVESLVLFEPAVVKTAVKDEEKSAK